MTDPRILRGLLALYLRSFVRADTPTAARRNTLLFGFAVAWVFIVLLLGMALIGEGLPLAEQLTRRELFSFLDLYLVSASLVAVVVPVVVWSTELLDTRTLEVLQGLRVPIDRAKYLLLGQLLLLPTVVAGYLSIVALAYVSVGDGVRGLAAFLFGSAAFLTLLVVSLIGLLGAMAIDGLLVTRLGKYGSVVALATLFLGCVALFVQFPEVIIDFVGDARRLLPMELSLSEAVLRSPVASNVILVAACLAVASVLYRSFDRWSAPIDWRAGSGRGGRTRPSLQFRGIFRGTVLGRPVLAHLVKDVLLVLRGRASGGWLLVGAASYAILPSIAATAGAALPPASDVTFVVVILFASAGTYLGSLALSNIVHTDGRCMQRYRIDAKVWNSWIISKLIFVQGCLAVFGLGVLVVSHHLLGSGFIWLLAGEAIWVATGGLGALSVSMRHALRSARGTKTSPRGRALFLLGSGVAVVLSLALAITSRVRPAAAALAGAGLGLAGVVGTAGLFVVAARRLRRAET